MKTSADIDPLAQITVTALALLGLLGGSLVVAHSGFSTSPKFGGIPVYVPAPQAYFMAALMYAMSIIGLIALLRARKLSVVACCLVVALYVGVAAALVFCFRP